MFILTIIWLPGLAISNAYFTLSVKQLAKYFISLTVSFHDLNSLYGFMVLLTIISQLLSGIMVAFSLIPESMLIPIVRDEEDLEDMYTDDFFWLHERGVDLVFIFSWLHLWRKFYLNVIEYEHEAAWKSGVFTFLIFHVVVFLGLVLCCTHLSEITLTIAANIMHTFFFFSGKPYWWIFTDKQLNSDTLIRLAYAHYLSAFYLTYIAVVHALDMHYDWKNESIYDGLFQEMAWWDEALLNELGSYIDVLVVITCISAYLYPEIEALSYEIFTWGDIGFMSDIRFYGVSPHWYFRAYMGWLIVCPHHKTGIFGLLFFLIMIFFQPSIHGLSHYYFLLKKQLVFFKSKFKIKSMFQNYFLVSELNLYHQYFYGFFIICAFYTASFLPYGRFFNSLGGNSGMLAAYFYLFFYVTFSILRRPYFIELFYQHFFSKVNFLENFGRYLTKFSLSSLTRGSDKR